MLWICCSLFQRTLSPVVLMLLCCVCLSSVTLRIVAKRCILEQKLLLTAYRKSYMRNRLVPNLWSWPLFRGRLRSCQPLCRICSWISRKPLEIDTWFQRTTSRKTGSQMVTWPRKIKLVTQWCFEPNICINIPISRKQLEMLFSNNRSLLVCCEAVRSAILATTWLLVEVWAPTNIVKLYR